jgi:hypothetical protein
VNNISIFFDSTNCKGIDIATCSTRERERERERNQTVNGRSVHKGMTEERSKMKVRSHVCRMRSGTGRRALDPKPTSIVGRGGMGLSGLDKY